MATWGLFARWPRRWGGGRPEAQRLYEAMRDNRGERYTRDDDADENKSLRATARAMSIAASYQRRGANQAFVQLATDELPKWERVLGMPRDPRDTDDQRRNLGAAIIRGNGAANYDNITAAVSLALDGETVTLVTATARERTNGGVVVYTATGTAVGSGSSLAAGSHVVGAAWEKPDGTFVHAFTQGSVLLTAGQQVLVAPIPLSTVAGAVRVHYYFSPRTGASSVAWVGSNSGGGLLISAYPSNPSTPGLHHIAIVVSAATAANRVKRAKIHAVVGPMLSAWTTYSIITESPFVLGVSPLGRGAF